MTDPRCQRTVSFGQCLQPLRRDGACPEHGHATEDRFVPHYVDDISQDIIEAVLSHEPFQEHLSRALAEEFTFIRATPEAWLKATKGVCSKMMRAEPSLTDDPTPGATGT